MTRDEFIAKSALCWREERRLCLGWLVAFVGVSLGIVVVSRYSAAAPSLWVQFLFGVVLVSLGIGSVCFLFWVVGLRGKKYGLKCPSCGKDVTPSGQVLATGRCAHCGAELLES